MMSHDHVSDDPALQAILRGDHFHDTPSPAARELVADWWAMVCERLPDGTHMLHLVPLDTDVEDDVVHVEVHKRRGKVRQVDNELINLLHVLPLYISVGGNDVLVSLTTRVHDATTHETREQERIWLFVADADLVEFSALEAEEFFEEQDALAGQARTHAYTDESITVTELGDDVDRDRLVLDEETWDELRVAAAADEARRRHEASVIAGFEDQLGDVVVPEELNGLFRDAWILDDFLTHEAALGVRAARFGFVRYVGPVEQFEAPTLRQRPALSKAPRQRRARK